MPIDSQQVVENPLVRWALIGAGGVVGAWYRIPNSVQILLMVMGLDVISGLFAAGSNRALNSSIMYKGLFKKCAVFPLLALLHIIEKPLNIAFELESVAAFAFVVYESMSIVENCATAGVPIPSVIVDALAKAKIKTYSADDIHSQFGDQTKLTVAKSTDIVKTPDSSPDLKIEKTTTTLEEQHVEPIQPKA